MSEAKWLVASDTLNQFEVFQSAEVKIYPPVPLITKIIPYRNISFQLVVDWLCIVTKKHWDNPHPGRKVPLYLKTIPTIISAVGVSILAAVIYPLFLIRSKTSSSFSFADKGLLFSRLLPISSR
jgi:hypothetical protein